MKKKRCLIITLILIMIVGVYCLSSLWISSNYLVVNEFVYTHEMADNDVKIVVISDLHGHSFGDSNTELIEKVKSQNPDLILMDGDFIDDTTKDTALVLQLISAFADIAPTYFALGNHELDYMTQTNDMDFMAQMTAAGAVILDKSYVDMEVNGVCIRLGGLYDYAFGGDNIAKEASQEIKDFLDDFGNTNNIKIMMSHRPDSFIFGDATSYWNVDLVITGHNHGGQVVFPLVGGLYGGDQGFFPEIDHGMFVKNDMTIFATSGLGSHKQLLPRFNNPPEIAVITLTAG